MPRRRLGLRVSNSSAGRLGQASQSMRQRSLSNSFSEQSEKRSAGCWDRCQDTGFLLGRSKLGVEVGREAARGGVREERKRRGEKGGMVRGRRVRGRRKLGKRKEERVEPGEGRGEGDEGRNAAGALRAPMRPRCSRWDPPSPQGRLERGRGSRGQGWGGRRRKELGRKRGGSTGPGRFY